MAKLSISTAWAETASFMGREARLVLPIGFLLIALPGALMQMAMPVPVPGQLPAVGWWLALFPVAVMLALIGNIAISVLVLRGGTSVAESLQQGARRFLFLLGAALLIVIGLAVVSFPLILAAGVVAMASGSEVLGGAVFLVLLLPLALFMWTRLVMMTPAAAVEEIGPIGIIQRSWTLTRGHSPKLLGFLLLMLVAIIVLSAVIGAIGGILVVLVAGPPDPGSVSAHLILVISALVQAVLSTLFAVMTARIYAQLTGGDPASVFS